MEKLLLNMYYSLHSGFIQGQIPHNLASTAEQDSKKPFLAAALGHLPKIMQQRVTVEAGGPNFVQE
jgi:hypothetical protein